MNFKRFSHVDSSGNEVGAVTIEHLWAEVYGLLRIKKETSLETEAWLDLFEQAMKFASEIRAGSVMYRLVKEPDSVAIKGFLPTLGFTKKSNRVEYKAEISDLPNDEGSPIHWTSASQLGWEANEVASCLRSVSEGAPDSEPSDDPLVYIQDWLKDPVLTHGPDCIAIGHFDGKLCALVVAQINPKTGWSRISYMGLTPDFRGKGLGKWVHRHGFQMMKQQGGRLYHGGTVVENLPMIKLFEQHGGKLFCEMEEWLSLIDGRQA